MITITVNGTPRTAESGPTVADVVADLTGVRVGSGGAVADGTALGMAVAVNATVVPRTAWVDEELADGDVVEIVSATQGG
jgi:sulfur carrier protein